MANEASYSGGIGFPGLLTILFIGLKLGHVIDWAWWWVLSPIWITAGIFLAVVFVILVSAVIVEALDW